MPIPKFRRSYRLKVALSEESKINIEGVDSNGVSFTIFKTLTVKGLSDSNVTYPEAKAQ